MNTNALIPVIDDKGDWGYINGEGEVVIPFEFSAAQPFEDDGLAWAQQSGKWVIICGSGEITPTDWCDIDSWDKSGLTWAVTQEGQFEHHAVRRDGTVVFVAKESPWYLCYSLWDERHGVSIGGENSKKGVYDRKGNIVLPFEYETIKLLDNFGILVAELESGRYQIFRPDGTMFNEFSFKQVNGDLNYLCASRSRTESLIWNIAGEVWEPSMDRFKGATFSWKLYPHQEDGKIGLKDESGSIIVPAVYEELEYDEDLPEGTFQVKQNGKMGLISRSNEIKIPVEWDSMNFLEDGQFVILQKKSRWGLYQMDEFQAMFEPMEGDHMSLLENGSKLLEIRKQGNSGIVDFSGETIVPIEWGFVTSSPISPDAGFRGRRKAERKMASRKGKPHLSEYSILYLIEGTDWAVVLQCSEKSVALVNQDLDILYSTNHSVDFKVYAIEEGESAWLVFWWKELVRPCWVEEGCDETTVEGCVCIDVDSNQVIWNTVNPK